MRLRIRHANGVNTLSGLSSEDTVTKLKADIINIIGLSVGQTIEISGGYPPKPISSNSATLSEAGLVDGDTLIVKAIVSEPIIQTPPQLLTTVSDKSREDVVETPFGYLTLRVMDDDNSCLFRSIGYEGAYVLKRDTAIVKELRQIIVDVIEADPVNYSDVTLGQPRIKYMEWIQKPNSWGGAIELAILSSHFKIEIDSIDVQTGRIDKFGEGCYDERVVIVYSGIHYDALALAPTSESPADFDQTRFAVSDEYILSASKQLADKLRKGHKFTDIANFTLKCEQCKTGLIGEKDAQNHASATGHTRFSEYQ
ncbi:unnamed protein product [Mucor hiemalis]